MAISVGITGFPMISNAPEHEGTAVVVMATHVGTIDPHVQYQSENELETIIDDLITTYNTNITV